MRLSPRFWKRTLAALGLKSGGSKRAQRRAARRPLSIEALECRAVLAVGSELIGEALGPPIVVDPSVEVAGSSTVISAEANDRTSAAQTAATPPAGWSPYGFRS